MNNIVPLDLINETDTICSLLHDSFKEIAEEHKLTKENSPTHNAFISQDQLQASIKKGLILFGIYNDKELIGCIGICKSQKEDCYYIEKLCVLTAYRHHKLGEMLLNYAINEVAKKGCNCISIGIINENEQLKQWYINKGFIEKNTAKFDNQSFTVCFLTMNIISLSKVSDDYVQIIQQWLNKDYVIKWFSDPKAWLHEIRLRHTVFSFIHHFIVFHNKRPIGFCQYYTVTDSNEEDYKAFMYSNAYSIDYVIGEEEYIGKGFGKLVVQELCLKIFNAENGDLIVVKPEKENDKSCNLLLSVGFEYDKETEVYVRRNIRVINAST